MRRTETTQFKVGLVAVRAISSGRNGRGWELRWLAEGREVKRRIFGLERSEVAAMAEHMTRETYCGRGYLPGMKAPAIQAAIATAIRLSRGNAETRADAARRAAQFVQWLDAAYPAVKTWDRLRPHMLMEYLASMEADKLAWDTLRLRLAPIRAAWRVMAENHPELVKPLPRLRLPARATREVACLEPAELSALLDWLRLAAPDLWAMGTMQGLAGLRTREAAALRLCDVDWDAGTITIADTERHAVKTAESRRTVPVCNEVMAALKATTAALRIAPITGELFPLRSAEQLTGRWRRMLRRAARELGNPRLGAIPARKLRAAFATMAGRLGLADRLVKAYMGHVAGDMLGTHYRRIGLDELRLVSGAVNAWRSTDFRGDVRKHSGNGEHAAAVGD